MYISAMDDLLFWERHYLQNFSMQSWRFLILCSQKNHMYVFIDWGVKFLWSHLQCDVDWDKIFPSLPCPLPWTNSIIVFNFSTTVVWSVWTSEMDHIFWAVVRVHCNSRLLVLANIFRAMFGKWSEKFNEFRD